ncbi:MAG: hypothetical protein FWG32_09665, partial [Oscillospiraceae bacterium]|nr:hypothetical protein [Oscillospiraceae bacterium]
MPYYKNSLILSSAIRFADYLTQSFRGGLFHSLFAYTREAYRNSATARLLSGAGFTEREWENSGLYKATLKIADFIPDFFYALCRGPGNRADPGPFSGYISRVLGQCALPVLGLMTLLMLTVPQEYWNNLYSLGITVFALALFYAAGAGDRVKRIDLKAVGPWPVIFAFI